MVFLHVKETRNKEREKISTKTFVPAENICDQTGADNKEILLGFRIIKKRP